MSGRRSRVGTRRKQNVFVEKTEFVEIVTSKGQKGKISLEDYSKVREFCWYGSRVPGQPDKFYLRTTIGSEKVYLHRFLFPEWKMIDHINGDRADNRRENLREVTPAQNSWNLHKTKGRTGLRGVSYHRDGFFYGRVYFRGKTYQTGSFGQDDRACFEACQKLRRELMGEYCGG